MSNLSDKAVTRKQAKSDPKLQLEVESLNSKDNLQKVKSSKKSSESIETPPPVNTEQPANTSVESAINSNQPTDVDAQAASTSKSNDNNDRQSPNSSGDEFYKSFFNESQNEEDNSEINSADYTASDRDNKIQKKKLKIKANQSSSNGNLPTAKMATNNISYKDALKVVPQFNGRNITLLRFLNGCDEAAEMIKEEDHGNLMKLIKSKLDGEAHDAVTNQTFATIDEFKDFLKSIYAPAKSVQQYLGDLGNQYQYDSETVISFVNRIRDIGNQILEAQKVATGTLSNTFKTSTENNVIECFKRGLKPEIENRLPDAEKDINKLVKEAIKIERELEARRLVREPAKSRLDNRIQFRKNVYVCQICGLNDHDSNNCTKNKQIFCSYCKRSNHTIEQCRLKPKTTVNNTTLCRICHVVGHHFSQCKSVNSNSDKCQLCGSLSHTAKVCRTQPSSIFQ